ncbi:unnamed protein product, partial [Bubo scandiacus]
AVTAELHLPHFITNIDVNETSFLLQSHLKNKESENTLHFSSHTCIIHLHLFIYLLVHLFLFLFLSPDG